MKFIVYFYFCEIILEKHASNVDMQNWHYIDIIFQNMRTNY